MSLRQDPYWLEFNEYVVARVQSSNAFGWSIMSDPMTGGAVILVEPTDMYEPVYMPL
jgi:hypothetical protein